MTDDYTMLGISSMLHLLVDGLCMCSLFLMSSLTDYSVIFNALIIYNVLAFLTQPFTGMMADKMPHRHWLLLTSNLILTLASLATLAVALYARQSPVVLALQKRAAGEAIDLQGQLVLALYEIGRDVEL